MSLWKAESEEPRNVTRAVDNGLLITCIALSKLMLINLTAHLHAGSACGEDYVINIFLHGTERQSYTTAADRWDIYKH